MIENQILPDHPLDNPAILGLVHTSGATLGAGVGILLAGRLGENSRKIAGVTLIASGVVLMAPLVVASIVKGLRRPNSSRSLRRRLNSIREGATYLDDLEDSNVNVR
jgi:hypothetical protein